MMKIQHIVELFSLDGEEFVQKAYRNLLQREPDENGMAYYLGRLAIGYSKADVILQLAQSPEFKPEPPIRGLNRLIVETKRQNHWLWGWIGRHQRLERTLHAHQAAISRQTGQIGNIPLQLNRITEQLSDLHGLAGQIGTLAAQFNKLNGQLAQMHNLAIEAIEKNFGGPQPLTAEAVRQAFIEILGREPENEAVIREHAKLGSIEALRSVLLNSEEFQTRVNTLPEYARAILKSHLQLLGARMEG